jgi:hypothetical protein
MTEYDPELSLANHLSCQCGGEPVVVDAVTTLRDRKEGEPTVASDFLFIEEEIWIKRIPYAYDG